MATVESGLPVSSDTGFFSNSALLRGIAKMPQPIRSDSRFEHRFVATENIRFSATQIPVDGAFIA